MAAQDGARSVLDALWARWTVAATVALAVFLGVIAYVERLPSQYETRAVVAFGLKPGVAGDGETIRLAAARYVPFATSPAAIARVSSDTGIDRAAIADGLDATVANGTANLTIVARLKSPDDAARVANSVAERVTEGANANPLLTAESVATAVAPNRAAGPPRLLLEVMGLLGGALLGLAIAVAVERAQRRLRSIRDVARVTGLPVLGALPPSAAVRSSPTGALADPEVGAALRLLRANLLGRPPALTSRHDRARARAAGGAAPEAAAHHSTAEAGAQTRIIAVTSADRREGRTTVAALLAEALARLGAPVLLLEADLRTPNVATSFGIRSLWSLGEVLRGQATLPEAARAGWAPGLSVVLAAPDTEPDDVLARGLADVLREASGHYAAVVIDTPAAREGADAATIAALATDVLLVVRFGTAAAAVEQALARLESTIAPMLGVVGNRVQEIRRARSHEPAAVSSRLAGAAQRLRRKPSA